jgi:DNA invertase Pin-like site-specific DNA recombinase
MRALAERERIRERVLAGLQRAKTQGTRLGRPRVAIPWERFRRVDGLTVDVARNGSACHDRPSGAGAGTFIKLAL